MVCYCLQGLLRSIGVSNFGIPHLEKLAQSSRITPAVNQIELHPWLQWRKEVEYCNSKGIVLEVCYRGQLVCTWIPPCLRFSCQWQLESHCISL